MAPLLALPALVRGTVPGYSSSGECGSTRGDIVVTGWRFSAAGACSEYVNYANICLDGQASGFNQWFVSRRTHSLMGQYAIPGGVRYQVMRTLCYPSSYSPAQNPYTPMALPFSRAALPVRMPAAIRDAIGGRFLPHGRDVANDPIPLPDPASGHEIPGVVIVVRQSPDGRTRRDVLPAPRPATRPQPQRPRERERKGKWKQAAAFMWNLLSQMSEARDFVEVVWKSLPRRYRRAGRKDTMGQVVDIFENIDKIELDQFVQNWVLNEIEDQIIGRAIGRARKVGYAQHIRQIAQNDSYALARFGRSELLRDSAWSAGIR